MFQEIIEYQNSVFHKEIGWLNNVFALSETQRRMTNGKTLKLPVIYGKKRQYTDLSPDVKKGNFAFWALRDSVQKVDDGLFSANFSVIFWLNYESIENKDERNIDKVCSDIIKALEMPNLKGKVELDTLYTNFSSVFGDYSLDDNTNQFFMQPYGAVRADVRLYARMPC